MTMLDDFDAAERTSRFAANRLLLEWLSDDDKRALLYQELRESPRRVLKFQSRADIKERTWYDTDSTFQQDVYLLASRQDVEAAMQNKEFFTNAPYRTLGSGTFMLGLDDAEHEKQRRLASAYLRFDDPLIIKTLANVAFKAGAVLPLKQRAFDLVELSEQAAARFIGFLFGFEQGDHYLIEQAMRKAYRGLNFLILGRHFVSEPGTIDEASREMGRLLIRVAELIDLYRARIGRDQEDQFEKIELELKELKEFKDRNSKQPLKNFVPVLRRIAAQEQASDYSGAELAVIVVGLIAGSIGNIQASVSIAINEFFRERPDLKVWTSAVDAAKESWQADPDYCEAPKLWDLIAEALRLNPPAAFLPRKTLKPTPMGGETIPAGAHLILAIGGATRKNGGEDFNIPPPGLDQLVFGGPPADHLHQCIGQHMAMPVITHFVRQILLLPGLVETFDPRTGDTLRLEKIWGFNCRKYPLEYTRSGLLTQSPLIVIMQVKSPTHEHADALKKVIRYGAPRIEKKLRDSKHVHFASFMFLENDTKLVLYTVYDRDFDAYIEHFALEIGPLFDRIFEHIEDAPPLPVNEYPKEFVDTIRRYNRRPAGGYFFSAYPTATVSMITQEFPAK
jgi:cytochrome P450